MLGKFVWHDLMATDVAASKRFYSELFGWRIWQGEHGGYEHVSLGEREIGGIVAPDPGRPLPAHWIGYVAVEDAAQTAARAKEAGGVVHLPPTEIPKIGRFTILGDPRGAAIAAFQATEWKPKDAAQPPPGEFCWDELLTDEPHAVVGFYRALFGWTDEPMEMPGFGTYHLFKRDGRDTFVDVPVSFTEAALGATIEVPSLGGDLELTLPAGTQSGSSFRLRGCGMPSVRGTHRGDHHVTVHVHVPTKLNKRQRELLEEYAVAGGDAIEGRTFFDRVKDAFRPE